ncbi:MAG: branched-chain amino acid ABC transporter permease, partial [Desulfoferrobacter sp.]
MRKTDRWIFAFVVLLIAIFPWVVLNISAISNYVEVMIFAGIFSLVCLGLSLLMGYAGQISLAQAAFFGIGAYSSGILTAHFGWNPWLAMPVGAALAAAVAWVVGVPALRLKGHYLAMATLGFGVIVHIVFNEEIDWTGGPSGMVDIPGLSIAGWRISSEIQWYYLIWGVVFLALLFCFHILHSRVGRALRAIHE